MNSPVARIGWLLYVRHRWQILFFSSCIAAGVAFLFSVGNILSAVDRGIARGARELLAADVRVSSGRPLGERELEVLERLARDGVRHTRVVSFASMLQPATGTPFLVSVKAVEEAYPFYGELVVEPPGYRKDFFGEKSCLIDASIALQHGLGVGDRVKLGEAGLTVIGIVRREPDRGLTSFSLAPRLFVPATVLPETGLLRTGSRIRHRALLAAPPSQDPARTALDLKRRLEQALDDPYIGISAFGEAQPSIRSVLDRTMTFFVLAALVALLIGAVGMSAGVTLFLNGQMETVGILRCLGLSPAQIARIYYAICLAIGLQGALLGTAAGWFLGSAGLILTKRVLGLKFAVEGGFSAAAMAEGLALACVLAVGVNAGKVRTLARLSPLAILRERTHALPAAPWNAAATVAAALAGIFAYTFYKSNSVQVARNFGLGLTGAGIALALLIAAGLYAFGALSRAPGTRRFFALRHGLLQLTRNKARSMTFLFTLSAGFSLIGALGLVHHSLSREILLGRAEDVPDLFLVDIQKSQLAHIRGLLKRQARRPPVVSPLVRARLTHINGEPVLRRDLKGMTVEERSRYRFLTREFNLTHKDRLNASEKLDSGVLWEPGETRPQVSLEKGFCKMTGLRQGDRLRFDIQGRSLEAPVTSVRAINWMSMNPNFFVTFPSAVLEQAPQNFVASLRVADAAKTAAFQKELVGTYPNISVIDIARILDNIQSVLGMLLSALSVVAWFCVAVGLLVLAGTLGLGRRERREQAALLRALGARRADIILTDACEFLAIGALTFLISVATAYGLGGFISTTMDITFYPAPGATAWACAIAMLLPLAVGLAVHWRAYGAGVLDTLRREA